MHNPLRQISITILPKRHPTRCPTCNCKELVVKDVKHGDAYPSKIVEWYDD